MMQGDGFASELSEIKEVATWLCAPLLVGLWSSLGLVPNYVVLVLGSEGGVLVISKVIIHMTYILVQGN